MFKNKTEFAQAMLNGQRFIGAGGAEYSWNGKEFLIEFKLLTDFSMYDSVTEILPEPWKPEPGEKILVSAMQCKIENYVTAEFIGMFEGFYMCKSPMKDTSPVVWRYAKPVPEENPWHDVVPGEWPECKPSDDLEMEGSDDKIRYLKATYVAWDAAGWKRWRRAK